MAGDIIGTWSDIKSNYENTSAFPDKKCLTKKELRSESLSGKVLIIDEEYNYSDNQLIPLSKLHYNFPSINNINISRMYSFTGSELSGNYKELYSVSNNGSNIISWKRELGESGTVYLEGFCTSGTNGLSCTIDGESRNIITTKPGGSGSTGLLGQFWISWGGSIPTSVPDLGYHSVVLSKSSIVYNFQVFVLSSIVDPTEPHTIIIENPEIIPVTGGFIHLTSSETEDSLVGAVSILKINNTYTTKVFGCKFVQWSERIIDGPTRTLSVVSGDEITKEGGSTTLHLS